MPIELVTKQEAYAQLRIDYDTNGSPHDPWLDIWIPAVSEAVLSWLKIPSRAYVPMLDSSGNPVLDSDGNPTPEIDSNGDMTPLWRVKAATLLELDAQFQFRAGEGKDNVVPADAGYGYILNKAATAQLAALRRSTVA